MTNLIFHLFQLQKIDSGMDRLRKRHTEIGTILKNNAEKELIDKDLQTVKSNYTDHQSLYEKFEERIKTIKVKILHSEDSLYNGGIKNPKELQDIQSEIQSLKKQSSILEDEQLEEMLIMEKIEEEEKILLQKMADFETRYNEMKRILLDEDQDILFDLTKKEQEKTASTKQISPHLLEEYETLRKSKNGVAVTSIEENSCLSCGATLTPSECQNAKSPSRITYCPSCGRILYAD